MSKSGNNYDETRRDLEKLKRLTNNPESCENREEENKNAAENVEDDKQNDDVDYRGNENG